MFPTYQQVPYALRRTALVANPTPLLRTGRLLHFVTAFLRTILNRQWLRQQRT